MSNGNGNGKLPDKLGQRIQYGAGIAILVTLIFMADPLRFWPEDRQVDLYVFGGFLTSLLILLGVQGIKWRSNGNG